MNAHLYLVKISMNGFFDLIILIRGAVYGMPMATYGHGKKIKIFI